MKGRIPTLSYRRGFLSLPIPFASYNRKTFPATQTIKRLRLRDEMESLFVGGGVQNKTTARKSWDASNLFPLGIGEVHSEYWTGRKEDVFYCCDITNVEKGTGGEGGTPIGESWL